MDEKLAAKSIIELSADYAQVVRLYEEAFPPTEQIDLGLLNSLAAKDGVDFLAYYDDGEFCGFSYSIACTDYLYLLFLAVDGAQRSKGLGARILAHLAEAHPDCATVLEIESLDPDAPNYDLRLARARFYERNGFSFTGYDMVTPGMTYTIMCTSDTFDPDAFVSALNAIAPEFDAGEEVEIRATED